MHHCLKSKNKTNLIIGSKQPTAVYLSREEADEHCRLGASIWHFASSKDSGGSAESTQDPDVVLVGIGVEVTFEVIKAAELLRTLCPALKIRVINVTDLMILIAESKHPHALPQDKFEELFTAEKPVLFNYHGYATELQGILFGRGSLHQMSVEGYREEGSTTTPFDMMLVNKVSRFDVASRALRAGAEHNEEVKKNLERYVGEIEKKVDMVRQFIVENGKGAYSRPNLAISTGDVTNHHITFATDPDDIYEVPSFA